MPERCCGTSVGVLIEDSQGRLLMIERRHHPVGVAPVAGHVADAHVDVAAAIRAEVREEVGLKVVSHHLLTPEPVWLPNLCAALPASPLPGHRWWIATATVTGEVAPDPEETRGARWYTTGEIEALAQRTVAHARGKVTEAQYEREPGLEPVWVELLHRAGVRPASEEERELARRLYTTPPRQYWVGGRLVPAAWLAHQGEDATRCVCGSALERARRAYGHLEGRDVWISRLRDDIGARYWGTLHVDTALPGYLWIRREHGGGRDIKVHVDDVLECTPA